MLLGASSPPRARPHGSRSPQESRHRRARPPAPAAIETGLEPWRLPQALARSVVFPGASGSLLVAGGLDAGGSSVSSVERFNPVSGRETVLGPLAAPVHDAASFKLEGTYFVAGGGTAAPTPEVETVATRSKSTITPALPAPRADDAAVTVGNVAYVLGGYDGTAGDATVLATRDGRHFTTVATLSVPVRYPAVAAVGGRILVFGGDSTAGARAGAPTAVVQEVDPATHSSRVVARLPTPLAGAAAVTLSGAVYLAGGETVGQNGRIGESRRVFAYVASRHSFLVAGHLLLPVSHAGVTVIGRRAFLVGGETAPGTETSAVQMLEPNRRFGTAGAPGAGSPYFGDTLLIADRGANELIALDDTGRTIWRYPAPGRPAPPGGLYFPDDAFFTDHGREIIANEEENDTIIKIAYPSGRLLWSYGHVRQPGAAPGYLDNPDDAYVLRDGNIVVADPVNCRVLVISPRKHILAQIGRPGYCLHSPPHFLGSPNGDTPLSDGNLLVSEINGSYVDEYTPRGRIVWATHLPISYPSDPQPLSPGRYLVADYEHPGAFIEFNRSGKVLYRYGPSSGTGELDDPSLVERLPSGVLMANDDYNDRMVAIDPSTQALVWQYGVTGVAGRAPGLLEIPDGFDLLGPNGTYPTHAATG